MQISKLKKGDYFTLRQIDEPEASQVYVRGDYDRSTKRYFCHRFDDICRERSFKGTKEVFTDFIF